MSSTHTALLSPPIQQRLDAEFPIATEAPADTHRFSPSTIQPSTVFRFPGVTFESTSAVRELMEENDRRFHIYQKISFQHNHLPHHLLTAYSLGASPKHLEAIFEDNVDHMAPIDRDTVTSKEVGEGKQSIIIDSSNWNSDELLGKKSNYAAYLVFFHSEIERIGGKACLAHYLFSSQANTQGNGNYQGPRMFHRFMAGIFHPFIHTGFGLEFKDQVMLAEGFAQAAVHTPDLVAALFPPDWPTTTKAAASSVSNTIAGTAANSVKAAFSRLSVQIESPSTTTEFKPTANRSRELSHPGLLELYAELCANEQLRPGVYDPNLTIDKRMRDAIAGGRAGEVQNIADRWGVSEDELVDEETDDGNGVSSGWARRVEELQVFWKHGSISSLYVHQGGDWSGSILRALMPFLSENIKMHCLTSSIFLPSFMQYLGPAQRAILLKSYLLVVLHTALSRGRPLIRPEVLLQCTANPLPPSRAGKSGASGSRIEEKLDVIGDPKDGSYGNPWLEVVDNCMYSKDSHAMKSIRSLLLYSTKYGHLAPGHLLGSQKLGPPGGEESIPGINALGGDIFVRAAGAVMHVMGWAKERKLGEEEGSWDMSALGWDDAWR
ncbi:hypothetical protein QFC22_005734 [Naganishia vaughanmartiniae]|uniref:Uncharacterized protein n=1 Tax=Naganishia vaughanmartiniae TaxID=1424756 RepID=A0ACC2WTB6_9TREE|nr:hypothetical protein QFC22_005734 [Naganishia vaughanmartiniae]